MKHARQPVGPSFAAKLAVFLVVSILWIALDRLTKMMVAGNEVGEVFVENVAGLFEFKLIHNTGAAWGILSESTLGLGIFSVVVCALIFVLFLVFFRKEGNMGQVLGLALVFAGGVGNAIDRLAYSYVVDFINATFIDFPVFNVADIGVTCGIAIFLIATLVGGRSGKAEAGD